MTIDEEDSVSELYQSLSHSKWDCKYHVVFMWCSCRNGGGKPSSDRRAVNWGRFFMVWRDRKNGRFSKGLMPDHVHMCITIPPKHPVAKRPENLARLTSPERQAVLSQWRNSPENLAKLAARNASPENKARLPAWNGSPQHKALLASPEHKARLAANRDQINNDPKLVAKRSAQLRAHLSGMNATPAHLAHLESIRQQLFSNPASAASAKLWKATRAAGCKTPKEYKALLASQAVKP
jgi:REP element-mobilizing transposase RayT